MKEILLGMVLGDGYLEPHGRGVRLEVIHSESQKSYIEWKHEELRPLSPTPLHYHHRSKYPFWRFLTKIHPYLAQLREIFYVGGRKVVPDIIESLLTPPESLAVWFMDDGTCDKRQGSILFETQCFPQIEIEKLQGCLWRNFGIRTNIHRSGRNRGLRLYVPVRESQKLKTIIEPYILPELKYKLPRSP